MAKKDENKEQQKEFIGTIDVTPTYEQLFPLFCEWIDSGEPEQKKVVKDELLKLSKLADSINEARNKEKVITGSPDDE
jgi:hypothetical protein